MYSRTTRSNPYPTFDELNRVLDYDSTTGNLYWKKNMSIRARNGDLAGTLTKAGYQKVRLEGRTLKSHRVCWILHYGENPQDKVIFHTDRNNANNKINNLEALTSTELAYKRLPRGKNRIKDMGETKVSVVVTKY